MQRTCPRRSSSGFTLVELLITVAIVALLSSIAVPLGEMAVQRSKEQELRSALREIRAGIDAYKQAFDDGKLALPSNKFSLGTNTAAATGYPPTLKILVEGVPDATNPKPGAKLYFLRRMPRDPFSTDPAVPADETWGKRSYASPPDMPKEGDDVFDVYTKVQGKGLNGIPYKDW